MNVAGDDWGEAPGNGSSGKARDGSRRRDDDPREAVGEGASERRRDKRGYLVAALVAFAVSHCAQNVDTQQTDAQPGTDTQTNTDAQPDTGTQPDTDTQPIEVTVDVTNRYQTLYGFGASASSLIYGTNDVLSSSQRDAALQAAFEEVGLNTGLLRMAAEFTMNDDDDPFNPAIGEIDWTLTDNAIDGVLVPGERFGFTDAFPAFKIDQRYVNAWMIPLRTRDYNRYLDEVAENVLLSVLYWVDRTGLEPELLQIFNEPTSGNRELRLSNDGVRGASAEEVVDIVKRAGARLRAAGFSRVRFLVPSEATPARSLAVARRLYDDPEARQYVGALAYHAYPYGSSYASPARILAESGAGRPDAQAVSERRALRDLATRFNVPLLMNEVSEGPDNQDFPYGSPHTVRARAVHIHDELLYAEVEAYFGMNLMWDRESHTDHFDNSNYRDEEDTIVLIDNTKSGAAGVEITGMGHAIGHYARWTRRGAVRVTAESADDRLMVTALLDDVTGRLTLVLINNHPRSRAIAVSLRGAGPTGSVDGEVSYGEVRWGSLPEVQVQDGTLRTTLPAESVATLSLSR